MIRYRRISLLTSQSKIIVEDYLQEFCSEMLIVQSWALGGETKCLKCKKIDGKLVRKK